MANCDCVMCDAPGCQICRDPAASELADICTRCGWEQDGIGGQTVHPDSYDPNQITYRSALVKELVDGMEEAGVWSNPRTRSATHRLLGLPSVEESLRREDSAITEGLLSMGARSILHRLAGIPAPLPDTEQEE